MSDLLNPVEAAENQLFKTNFPNFLTIAELVTATKVSRQTISRKIKLGEIPNVKVGSRILIPISYLVGLEKSAWSNVVKVG
ncbi:MAG: helix-turn-helix domain-containing protein [Treponema sp.]|nr:helix-turn-helix domain-containing protein [Treponema sp.]MCL2272038.1 helix-turn-helix domain-containing protein [Treponema sp.]